MIPYVKIVVVLVIVLTGLNALTGQTNHYLTHQDSDPAAAALLEKMQNTFLSAPVELSFEIQITYPGEEAMIQKGTLVQQHDMYRIKTDDAEIWCDGALRWILLAGTQEVNLYSADPDENTGPAGLISQYTGDDFIAAISGEENFPGQTRSQLIELKPADRDSDIAKVRIAVKANGEPVRMEIFEKTGTRTVLSVGTLAYPTAREVTYFRFDKSKHPGVRIEDLRID